MDVYTKDENWFEWIEFTDEKINTFTHGIYNNNHVQTNRLLSLQDAFNFYSTMEYDRTQAYCTHCKRMLCVTDKHPLVGWFPLCGHSFNIQRKSIFTRTKEFSSQQKMALLHAIDLS